MKEIGGYIELDKYNLPMLHEGAIGLNCGRNALAYLLRARNIKRLWIPKYICDSVTEVCEREQVACSFYSIRLDFLPSRDIQLGTGEWLYFVNYYSQFDNVFVERFVKKYKRVIVDNAHSYFQMPVPDVDTLYTCRKYFGVADGAFLYTNAVLNEELPKDESFGRMNFLLGRFEHTASEFYSEYVSNNARFKNEPIKIMSKLTYNLLHGIDYKANERIRKNNFEYLHEKLRHLNHLRISNGTFVYPLLIDNGAEIRKKLKEIKIYVPTLWTSVFSIAEKKDLEYKLSENILPLPIDQRYTIEDMAYMIEAIKRILG